MKNREKLFIVTKKKIIKLKALNYNQKHHL